MFYFNPLDRQPAAGEKDAAGTTGCLGRRRGGQNFCRTTPTVPNVKRPENYYPERMIQ